MIKNASGYAVRHAARSLFCLQTTFGTISPKIRIRIVMTTVAIVAASPVEPCPFPICFAMESAMVVEVADAAMLTKLLPTSTAVSASSNLSEILSANFAMRLPSSASFFRRTRLTEV